MDTSAFDLSIKLLKEHEGLRLKPYRCTSGKLTIGYGRNLEDRGIDPQEAQELLLNDIKYFFEKLNTKYSFFSQLNNVRQAVLVDMAFNLGLKNLDEFEKLILALHHFNFNHASNEMLNSKWAKQVGNRAYDLAQMMLTGKEA